MNQAILKANSHWAVILSGFNTTWSRARTESRFWNRPWRNCWIMSLCKTTSSDGHCSISRSKLGNPVSVSISRSKSGKPIIKSVSRYKWDNEYYYK